MITLFVDGVARPKGSLRFRGAGRAPVEQSSGLPKWRKDVAEAIFREIGGWHDGAGPHVPRGWPWAGPVNLGVRFVFPRPARQARPAWWPGFLAWPSWWPVTRRQGDLDKCVRAIGDAAQDANMIADDSQIVRTSSIKVYAEPGERTGVRFWLGSAVEAGEQLLAEDLSVLLAPFLPYELSARHLAHLAGDLAVDPARSVFG